MAASLWSVLSSGYAGDDIYASQMAMDISASETNRWDYFVEWQRHWLHENGRFFPGSLGSVVVLFTNLHSRFAYKCLQLAAVISVVAAFVVFIRQLTRQWPPAVLGGLLAVSALQIRLPYDGVSQFVLQQPLRMMLVMVALLAFQGWLSSRRRTLLATAVVAFTTATLVYEASALLLPCIVVLAWASPVRWRVWAKAALLVGAPALALTAVAMVLRAGVGVQEAGYTSVLTPSALIPTFGKQFAAALPTSRRVLGPPAFLGDFGDVVTTFGIRQVVALVALGIVVTFLLRHRPIIESRLQRALSAIGAFMWVTPALVVAQTQRWQTELEWGTAYIPVFTQTFGFALVAVAGTTYAVSRRSGRRAVAGALICGAIVLATALHVTIADNARTIAEYGPGTLQARETFEAAVERGVFDGVPPHSRMFANWITWHSRTDLTADPNPSRLGGWSRSSLVEWYGGPSLEWVNEPTDARQMPQPVQRRLIAPCGGDLSPPCDRTGRRSFALDARGAVDGPWSYVAVGTLTLMETPAPMSMLHFSSVATVYVERLGAGDPCTVAVVDAAGDNLVGAERSILRRGDGWCLMRLEPSGRLLALARLVTAA